MKILGIIPARISSTRLPRKPLVDIKGKTLIQRVYESCQKSKLVSDLIVATDSDEIYKHVLGFKGNAILTSPEHPSGTSRVIAVVQNHFDYDGFLNIQGDNPILEAEHIDLLAQQLLDRSEEELVITPVFKTYDQLDVFSPNSVKAVVNKSMEALYFSRQAIPYCRGVPQEEWADCGFWKHLGLYGYTKSALQKISSLSMSKLESAECLEQLSWLYHGIKIQCVEVSSDILSIDTPEDLERVKSVL